MEGLSYISSATGALAQLVQWFGERYTPAEQSRACILVPNRRVMRELQALWAERNQLPPRMVALGSLTHTDALSVLHNNSEAAAEILAIPNAVPQEVLAHHMVRCVMQYQQKRDGHASLERALALSAGLTSLLEHCDQAGIELSAEKLEALAPNCFARHWRHSSQFLGIIADYLPLILGELNAISTATQQRMFVELLAKHAATLESPLILFGSSGSVPYVRALMAALAAAPMGHVVLPGTPNAYDAGEGQAHYFTQAAIDAMGAEPKPLCNAQAQPSNRRALLCTHEEEEARIIAALMREAAVESQKTTMLVTRDIGLMRRVAAQLATHGIVADSPSITRLSDTQMGQFIISLTQLIANKHELMAWHAWLHHPWVGAEDSAYKAWLEHADMQAFRGVTRYAPVAYQCPSAVGEALENWYRHQLPRLKNHEPLDAWLTHLLHAAEMAGIAEEHMQQLADWAAATQEIGGLYASMHAEDMAALLQHQLAGAQAAAAAPTHAHLRMLTPVEARLMHADRVIFGAFHEAAWGNQPTSQWLNDAQLHALGLPTRAANQSLTRHDIAMHASAPECYVTRAQMVNHSPSTPYAAAHHYIDMWESASEWHAWANSARNAEFAPIAAVAPTPNSAARPTMLPVKALERVQENPYEIYAEHVLGLKELQPYGSKPEPMNFGIMAHRLMEMLAGGTIWSQALCDQLLQQHDCSAAETPFWSARLHNIAAFAEGWLPAMQVAATDVHTEYKIEHTMGSMQLKGRIDAWFEGGESILVDYKTGSIPNAKSIESGSFCQLTTYGMMLHQQTGQWPAQISYVRLPDVKNAADTTSMLWEAEAWQAHADALRGLMDAIQHETNPFIARPYGLQAKEYRAVDGVSRALETQMNAA